MDECSLEYGVLVLVLKRQSPQRMRLRRTTGSSAGSSYASSSVAHGLTEDSVQDFGVHLQVGHFQPDRQPGPEVFAMTPARTVDSVDAPSSVPTAHWLNPPGVSSSANSKANSGAGVVTQPLPPQVGQTRKLLVAPRSTSGDLVSCMSTRCMDA
jgi:hypothetical protein